KRVRAILDNTQAGLITLDAKGRIESVNPTAVRLFEYDEADLRGAYFSKLLSQHDRPSYWQHITAPGHLRAKEMMIEATGLRASGDGFPIELIIGEMRVGDARRFIVTVHDITERKLYEERLQRARDLLESRVEARTADLTRANEQLVNEVQSHQSTRNELIQTAKLAVLGQMSAGINHELNQPLTAIRAYADNARAFLAREQGEVADMNLAEIASLTERMAKIIHPLKEFSRNTSGQPEPVCLGLVRDGAMSIMYGRLEKEKADIGWPENFERVYVLADMVRLEQVFVNLLTNGLQAMDDEQPKRLEIGLERRPGFVKLSVRDFGTGIAESDLDRVFEPFYTTKKSGQGLGLGLSISHRIISSLNGRMWVENHPAGGAIFFIELPSAEVLQTLSESVSSNNDER
ncbi:MAG: PAS domain-containing sensor histidine kinase, partial [Pontibacterium sp.]